MTTFGDVISGVDTLTIPFDAFLALRGLGTAASDYASLPDTDLADHFATAPLVAHSMPVGDGGPSELEHLGRAGWWEDTTAPTLVADGLRSLLADAASSDSLLQAATDDIERPLDDPARLHRREALAAYQLGRFHDAARDLLTATSGNPTDHIAWLHLGHIALRATKYEKALDFYGRADRAAHSNAAQSVRYFALVGLSRVLQELDRAEEAADMARQATLLPTRGRWVAYYEEARSMAELNPERSTHALAAALRHAPVMVTALAATEPAARLPVDSASDLVLPAAQAIRTTLDDLADTGQPALDRPPDRDRSLVQEVERNHVVAQRICAELKAANRELTQARARLDQEIRESHQIHEHDRHKRARWDRRQPWQRLGVSFAVATVAVALAFVGFAINQRPMIDDYRLLGIAFLGFAALATLPVFGFLRVVPIDQAIWPPPDVRPALGRSEGQEVRYERSAAEITTALARIDRIAADPLAGAEFPEPLAIDLRR